jgi:hypothetical protein
LLDKLRDQMAAYFSQHRVCVLSTAGSQGAWAMPVRYRNHGLELECLLPRWTDVAYHLEQDPRVMVVILDTPLSGVGFSPQGPDVHVRAERAKPYGLKPGPAGDVLSLSKGASLSQPDDLSSGASLRWLQLQGTARPIAEPDWAGLLPWWRSTTPVGELYVVYHVTPERIDLFDESQGWGVRETLKL